MKRLLCFAGMLLLAASASTHDFLNEAAPPNRPAALALIDSEAAAEKTAQEAAKRTARLETFLEARLRESLGMRRLDGSAFYLGTAGAVFVVEVPYKLAETQAIPDDVWENARREVLDGAYPDTAEIAASVKAALLSAMQDAEWDWETYGPATAAVLGRSHSMLKARAAGEISVRSDTVESSPELEDAAVMARVIEKYAEEEAIRSVRGVPVEGFGVLFLARSSAPLAPPLPGIRGGSETANLPESVLDENNPDRGLEDLAVRPEFPRFADLPELDEFPELQDRWNQLETWLDGFMESDRMKSLRNRISDLDLEPFLPRPREYDPEIVESLKTALLAALENGSRMRLGANESLAVFVRGAPAMETIRQERSEDGEGSLSVVTITSSGGSTRTYLAARVSKADADEAASGAVDAETFRGRARFAAGFE